jgi:hypothetical protein
MEAAMKEMRPLLREAIEENVAWCRTICAAHRAREQLLPPAWMNLAPSPPYYPNLVTREPASGASVLPLVDDIIAAGVPPGWGIKDSFADLDLAAHGFTLALAGDWFGGTEPATGAPERGWKKVASPDELLRWEMAWGGEAEHRVFPEPLLADPRIAFWHDGREDAVEAGLILFRHDRVVGLSNWFSDGGHPLLPDEAIALAGRCFPGVPFVYWSSGDAFAELGGRYRLGPLRVWIATR